MKLLKFYVVILLPFVQRKVENTVDMSRRRKQEIQAAIMRRTGTPAPDISPPSPIPIQFNVKCSADTATVTRIANCAGVKTDWCVDIVQSEPS